MEVGMLMSKRASKEEGLDYPTFLCFMVDGGTYKSAKEDRIRYGFQLFDDQSTGRITHKGLTRIFKDVGMGYNDAIIEAMIGIVRFSWS
jgi:Ca2+-binding EF-hand superfamily protein